MHLSLSLSHRPTGKACHRLGPHPCRTVRRVRRPPSLQGNKGRRQPHHPQLHPREALLHHPSHTQAQHKGCRPCPTLQRHRPHRLQTACSQCRSAEMTMAQATRLWPCKLPVLLITRHCCLFACVFAPLAVACCSQPFSTQKQKATHPLSILAERKFVSYFIKHLLCRANETQCPMCEECPIHVAALQQTRLLLANRGSVRHSGSLRVGATSTSRSGTSVCNAPLNR